MKSPLIRASLGSLGLTVLLSGAAQAGKPCAAPCGPPCPPPMVEKTICVPETSYVHKKVWVTEFSVEVREQKRMCMIPQPRRITVQKTCTVMVPTTEKRAVTRSVLKPVMEEVEETCVVCVPHTEIKKGTRQVVHCVPVTKTRKVCLDEGCWQNVESKCEKPCCNGCGHCSPVCRRLWVPKLVTKEVEYTTWERVCKEEPYECEVTVMKPVTKTRTVQRRRLECEEVTEEVECLVLHPKQVTREVEICTWDCVPVEKIVPCTVVVPHRVEREIVVPVCRMVEKKIMVPACP